MIMTILLEVIFSKIYEILKNERTRSSLATEHCGWMLESKFSRG